MRRLAHVPQPRPATVPTFSITSRRTLVGPLLCHLLATLARLLHIYALAAPVGLVESLHSHRSKASALSGTPCCVKHASYLRPVPARTSLCIAALGPAEGPIYWVMMLDSALSDDDLELPWQTTKYTWKLGCGVTPWNHVPCAFRLPTPGHIRLT